MRILVVMRWNLVFLPILLLTLGAAPVSGLASESATATPTSHNCLGECRQQVFLWQGLAGQINPLGLENQLTASFCVPLSRRPGVLFDLSSLEIGLINYTSPVYVRQGAFVSLTPVSFLQLDAEMTAGTIWSVPDLDWGYVRVSGYHADVSPEARPSEHYGNAFAFTATLGITLRGRVPLGGRLALVGQDTAKLTTFQAGDSPYWYNSRYDAIQADVDAIVENAGGLLLELSLGRQTTLLVGFFDELTLIPRSGHLGNIVGLLSQLRWTRLTRQIDLAPFVRAGLFTHHPQRDGFNFTAGISATYRLWSGTP